MSMNERRVATRGLTEGALLAGLTVVIIAVGVIIPFAAVLLAPLPVAVLVIRWGPRVAVLASVVAVLILTTIFGPVRGPLSGLVFAPTGLMLGWSARRGFSAGRTTLLTALVLLAVSIVSFGVTIKLMGINPLDEQIRIQVQAWKTSLALQRRLGAPAQQVKMWEQMLDQLPTMLRTVMPAVLVMGALLWAYFIYSVARTLFRRFGHDLQPLPPMLEWRIPSRLVWAVILALGVTLAAARATPYATQAFSNLQIAMLMLFGFQGLLVGFWVLRRYSVPRWMQVVIAFLVLSVGFSWFILMWIGLLDTWFNYRRIGVPRDAAAPPSDSPGTPTPA